MIMRAYFLEQQPCYLSLRCISSAWTVCRSAGSLWWINLNHIAWADANYPALFQELFQNEHGGNLTFGQNDCGSFREKRSHLVGPRRRDSAFRNEEPLRFSPERAARHWLFRVVAALRKRGERNPWQPSRERHVATDSWGFLRRSMGRGDSTMKEVIPLNTATDR